MRPVEEDPAGFAVSTLGSGTGVHRSPHLAMATVFEIYTAYEDKRYALQAAQCAFDLVDRLELTLSRFIEGSDVSRINRLRLGETARVSEWTMECLQIAGNIFSRTHRAFDISLGTGFDRLELAPADFEVRAHAGGIRLDLGAIGKGYAVDRMAEVLREWEIDRALLHAGCSSVVVMEAPPDCAGWPVTLSIPGKGDSPAFAKIITRQQCLGASGSGKKDHILDPRIGKPVQNRLAAWLAAPLEALASLDLVLLEQGSGDRAGTASAASSPAAVADALSTAFMILEGQEISEICRTCPGMEAWIFEKSLQAGTENFPPTHYPA